MVVIKSKSKKLILRYPKLSDLKLVYGLDTEPTAKKMFMSSYENIREARKDLMEHIKENKRKNKSQEHFIIDFEGKSIGHVWLSLLSNDICKKHQASLGYVISKECRGKGIGTKALRLLVNYAFKRYKLKRLATYTRTFNKASRRMLEKLGFKLEGILRKNKWKEGKYLDDCMYAKVK